MKAQDILPQYEAVVAEYDVNILLCAYGDAGVVSEDIVSCVASHTSPKWARGVHYSVKEIVDGVVNGSKDVCDRIEKYCFVFDKDFFLGYDQEQGIVLRRRA